MIVPKPVATATLAILRKITGFISSINQISIVPIASIGRLNPLLFDPSEQECRPDEGDERTGK